MTEGRTTREKSEAALQSIAALVDEPAGAAAVHRLLERVSVQDDPEALRDLLVERGAAAVLEDTRGWLPSTR